MVENIGLLAVFPKTPEDQMALVQKLAADLELKEEDFVPEAISYSPNTRFETPEMKIRAYLRELFLYKWEHFYKKNPERAPLFFNSIVWEWPPKLPEGEIQIRLDDNEVIESGPIKEIPASKQFLEMLGDPNNLRSWDWIIVWYLGDRRELRLVPDEIWGMPAGRFVLFPDEMTQVFNGETISPLRYTNFDGEGLNVENIEMFKIDEDRQLMKIAASRRF